ncbi:MAG TPA: aminotransferase class IV [Patescibacteria group bacterium]|nr:aminotransferase class IV [Patescibacteria group bacterium]
MNFPYFSKNGQILPIEQAVVPLFNIEFSYGFGVYENIKVRNGIAYFTKQHSERLLHSAEVIGLEHQFSSDQIEQYLKELLEKLELTTDGSCNIKIVLIGGREPQLFILALAPFFPDRKLYSEGTKVMTIEYERFLPQAKTLNMLPSYLHYKKAKEAGCYDALLISNTGMIIEGTRTNFFAIKGRELFTPPAEDVLEGVTRQTVIATAKKHDFIVHEVAFPLAQIGEYEGAFLTSTSSKIVPIRQIDELILQIPEHLRELMHAYDTFLKESEGKFV